MFDYKHVYVSLLKHKCLKVKHVSVSCFYSVACIYVQMIHLLKQPREVERDRHDIEQRVSAMQMR